MTVNGKEKDIAAILSFNHGNDTNEKFSTTKNLSTKTTTRLLNEVENFSSKRKINPITVDDVAATYSQKRNSTSPPECMIKVFTISWERIIDSIFVTLTHEEYIDIEATSLR